MATARGSLNVCTGTETIQQICTLQSAYSVNEFIQVNSINFKKYNPDECAAYNEYIKLVNQGKSPRVASYPPLTQLFINGVKISKTQTKKIKPTTLVKEYLRLCNNYNLKVVQGLVVVIPFKKNGGVIETSKYYLDNRGIPKLLTNTYISELNRAKSVKGFIKTKYATVDSYFQRVTPTGEKTKAALPVIPQEFSDSNSVSWNSVSLMGRSVDYQIYTGSSREVSFTLQLHQEVYNDAVSTGIRNIYNLVKLIESSCYPYYSEAWAGPPQVVFKIGNHLYIKGVLTSCNVNWKLPIDLEKNSPTYGLYTNCEISISVRETNGPYGSLDIANGTGGGEGSYRDKTIKAKAVEAEPNYNDIDTTTLSNPELGEHTTGSSGRYTK